MQLRTSERENTIRNCQKIQIMRDSGYKVDQALTAAGLKDRTVFDKITNAMLDSSELTDDAINLLTQACRALSKASGTVAESRLAKKFDEVCESFLDILPYRVEKILRTELGRNAAVTAVAQR